jgi:hypothetical protein
MKRKPHTEETKRKISKTLRERKLGNHIVKGANIGAKVGGGYGALQGAVGGGIVGGPLGALGGGLLGSGFGAYSGAVSGSAYGAGTYATRKGLDKLRGRNKYKYDYSQQLEEKVHILEFKRGKDKRKRKKRSSALKKGLKIAGATTLAAGGLAALRYADPALDGYAKAVANKMDKKGVREVVKRNVKRAVTRDIRAVRGLFGAKD